MPTKLYLCFPHNNLHYEILPDQEITAGRMSTCNVDLTRYLSGHLKAVSRQHFKIFYSKGEGFILVDMSHNGTAVNGQQVGRGERRILRQGDVLKLAGDENLLINVEIEDDPDITDSIDDPAAFFIPAKPAAEPGFYFDRKNARFIVDSIPVPHEHLTRLEVALLKYFYDNFGRLCLFDAIAAQVWDDPAWAPSNNTISRAVGNLRKKLDEVSPGAGDYIQNIRGQGYLLTGQK
jgi:pSer/pThr/pTyr-binding forkhead associated (FHA) protein